MKKTTIVLMLLTLLSQILGFIREMTLAYFYGASYISDAYLISILIPGLIIGIIASGISSAYIPLYTKITSTNGRQDAYIFTSRVINTVIILSFFLLVGSYFFLEEIIKIFAYGFNDESLKLTKKLTKITLLSIFFVVLIPILSGFLQNNKNYIAPALVGIPFNLIILVSIFLSHSFGLMTLSFGFLAANIFSIVIMGFLLLIKHQFTYKLSVGVQDKHIKKLLFLALPVILGVSFNQINILIDKTIASDILVGGITALHYSNRINLSIDSIITLSFMVMFFPVMSKLIAEDKKNLFSSNVKDYIKWVSLLIIPSSVILMFFSTEIIALLFGRGAFDSKDIEMTSGALLYYSFGMIGVAVTTILTKACYALQNTSLPMKILIFGIILNITTSIILSRYIGINGLALGTSISALVSSYIQFQLMKKKYPFLFNDFHLVYLLLKIFLTAAFATFIGKQLLHIFNQDNAIYTSLTSIFFTWIIYLLSIHIMKLFDMRALLSNLLLFIRKHGDMP